MFGPTASQTQRMLDQLVQDEWNKQAGRPLTANLVYVVKSNVVSQIYRLIVEGEMDYEFQPFAEAYCDKVVEQILRTIRDKHL